MQNQAQFLEYETENLDPKNPKRLYLGFEFSFPSPKPVAPKDIVLCLFYYLRIAGSWGEGKNSYLPQGYFK